MNWWLALVRFSYLSAAFLLLIIRDLIVQDRFKTPVIIVLKHLPYEAHVFLEVLVLLSWRHVCVDGVVRRWVVGVAVREAAVGGAGVVGLSGEGKA